MNPKISKIKPAGLLVSVSEAPFYDMREKFFYWDNVVPIKKDDVLQLDTAKILYTAEQMQKYKNDGVKDIFENYNIFDSEGRRMQLGDLLEEDRND